MGTDLIRPTLFISTRSVRRRKDIYQKILKIIGKNTLAPSIATKPYGLNSYAKSKDGIEQGGGG